MGYIYLVLGLALLVKGAEFIIDSASLLAKQFRITNMAVGLTVVALGASLPEFTINLFAALKGSSGIALGNVIGSNIANTLLTLGVIALIRPIKTARETIGPQIVLNLLATIVLLVIANIAMVSSNIALGGSAQGMFLGRLDGGILLFFLVLFLYFIYKTTAASGGTPPDDTDAPSMTLPLWKNLLYAVVGLASLYVGGSWAVHGAMQAARDLGLPEFVVSATILALGTSLPELATCVTAAMKDNSDLAIGSVVGSNILNIFWILGVTTLVLPVPLPATINIHICVLVAASFLLLAFAYSGHKHLLSRWQGGIFLFGYLAYVLLLVLRYIR